MSNLQTALTGQAVRQQSIQIIEQHLAEYREILSSKIIKASIGIHAIQGMIPIRKIFTYPVGHVPGELQGYFERVVKALEQDLQELKAPNYVPRIKIGEDIIQLDNFIKEYTAGSLPSLSEHEALRIIGMLPRDVITIILNQKPFIITRL